MVDLPNDPKTAMEQYLDAMLRHQIGLLRVSGSIRNEIVELLDATEADVRKQIGDLERLGAGFSTSTQVERLGAVLSAITEIRQEAWKPARDILFRRVIDVMLREPAFVDQILKTTMPVDLKTALPNARRLRAIVRAQPFEGRTLREWAAKIESDDIARIHSQIKVGLTQGQTIPQIARRVVGTVSARGADGVTAITRRHATAITRTAVNAVGNFARREYHEENSDLIFAEIYVATLDSRTTLVCASNDGKQFPIGVGPMPPLHINCRSLRVGMPDPEVIGVRPARAFTQRQLLREFAAEEGLARAPRTRAGLPRGTKGRFDAFARSRMRELTGQVPSATEFSAFLRSQPASFQSDYLGVTKARLFRSGKLPLDRMVDPSGRPLSLDELAVRERQAFIDAGLDPDAF